VWNERFVVVSNGTHTRPIFERLKAGNAPRDAVLTVLAGLDREFDQYDTPRICGVLDVAGNSLWLGSITATAFAVMPVDVEAGQMAYITTYSFPLPSPSQVDLLFNSVQAAETCRHITEGSRFADFDKPICAAAALVNNGNIEVATLNVER
jgi:IMP cyclohydrolase